MRLWPAIASAALAVLPLGAAAQVTFKEPTSDPVAVAVMNGFARCVADTAAVGARQALGADYRAPGYYGYIRSFAIAHKTCLRGGQLRFNQVLLVGGMAEELNRKAGLTVTQLASAAGSDRETVPERCLIRKQPARIWSLFATAPGSHDEGEAIDALRPDYAMCQPSDRVPIYNTLNLRALLALSVYRLMNNAPALPAKG